MRCTEFLSHYYISNPGSYIVEFNTLKQNINFFVCFERLVHCKGMLRSWFKDSTNFVNFISVRNYVNFPVFSCCR
jgi:hypothetical protein